MSFCMECLIAWQNHPTEATGRQQQLQCQLALLSSPVVLQGDGGGSTNILGWTATSCCARQKPWSTKIPALWVSRICSQFRPPRTRRVAVDGRSVLPFAL